MSPLRVLRSQFLYTNFLQLGSHLLKGPSIDSMSLPGWAGGITWIQSNAEASSLFQFQHSEWNRVGNCESLSVCAAFLCWYTEKHWCGTFHPSLSLQGSGAPTGHAATLRLPVPSPWTFSKEAASLLSAFRSLPLHCYRVGN